jgi:heat shock protein HtpX
MNTFKTFILMLLMTLVLVWVGKLIGGNSGMMLAFILAAGMNFFSYWFSDKIVLMMYRAKELGPSEMPELHSTVRNLCVKDEIPVPRLYIVNSDMPNAFATGRNPSHAAVVVTSGIVSLLNSDELGGVIAHELSHVKNRDILISTIAATFAGAIFMISRMAQFAAMFGGYGRSRDNERGGGALGMIALAILAPLAAMIIQMAISRSREYQADESGAKLSGKPLALANALRKLGTGVKRNPAGVSPATAHLFIVNPFSGKSLLNLFSTHPPLEERIKRLENMGNIANKSGF